MVSPASWQYSLQYLLSAGAMQLQAGCAHFFRSAMQSLTPGSILARLWSHPEGESKQRVIFRTPGMRPAPACQRQTVVQLHRFASKNHE